MLGSKKKVKPLGWVWFFAALLSKSKHKLVQTKKVLLL